MVWFAGSKKYPFRMNTTTVEIMPLKRSHATNQELLDEDFKEMLGPPERMPAIPLNAQVVFEQFERKMTLFNGDTKPIVGRLVFRTKDLQTILATYGLDKLNTGDLITRVEDTETEYLIVEVRPTAMLRTSHVTKATAQTTTAFFGHNTQERAGARGVG